MTPSMVWRRSVPVNGVLFTFDFSLLTYNDSPYVARDPASVRPMLATTATTPLDSAELVYERKYDGIRAIVAIEPEPGPSVRFWSRLGNDKTAQFPEIAARLQAFGSLLGRPVVLDGEIVALDHRGHPVSFQHLQGRMHAEAPSAAVTSQAVAFVAFDLLRDGDEDLRTRPLRERRRRLETLFAGVEEPGLRLSELTLGDGRALRARAETEGWEGLIAKRLDSTYASGRRSPEWRKLKSNAGRPVSSAAGPNRGARVRSSVH